MPATPVPTETPDAIVSDETGSSDEMDWRAFVPSDTADHLATMDRAARESGCGVPWQLLAAIARVESDFGRNMATSSAGAIGYGQFLPASWQAFGNEGNAYDYRDALPAIAHYLCQSGLARDPRAALFAYNHADWYVDMVLDLAVRYDRMAPGAPTPQVLTLDPDTRAEAPMRFGFGRDLRQSEVTRDAGGAHWLGVPWRGRTLATPTSVPGFERTIMDMLCAAFTCAAPIASSNAPDLETQAWDVGLLAWPSRSPTGWSLAELRRRIAEGQPVLVLVNASALPGHEDGADQPILVIGATPAGLIISDPSFASSLGYGLEVGDVQFLKAWQTASTPLQAVGFSRAPRSTDSHAAVAHVPQVMPRVVVTPPPAAHSDPPAVLNLAALPMTTLVVRVAPADDQDWSSLILTGSAVLVIGAVVLRLRRRAPGRATTAPPRSGR